MLEVKKNTESKNPNILKTKNELMPSLKCVVCDSEKWSFIKKQEASELLSNLGIRTYLSQIPLVGPLLF